MYLSYQDIEEIAEAVMDEFNAFFFGNDPRGKIPHATPIDQFARDFLKLDVRVERLCSDSSISGVTAYSDTELHTTIFGYPVCIPLSQNEVIIDIEFMQPGNVQRLCGKRRFTLAHECAHQILFQMESDEGKAACRRQYSDKRSYTAKELKSKEDWNEWQANVLGAAILLPRKGVSEAARALLKGRRIISAYGKFTRRDREVIYEIADYFRASPQAVAIRLERLGFIYDRTLEDMENQRLEGYA